MKNLVLVGFMGSGKSSAGRLAAGRMGMQFVDMDALIEQRLGQTVAEIFETKGEPFFRQQEKSLVKELAACDGLTIATGGGVVLDPENIASFTRTGVVICCWVDALVAFERTKHTNHRPLLATDANRFARVESLLRQRTPLYKAIPLQIDTSAMTVEQQADAIVRLYNEHAAEIKRRALELGFDLVGITTTAPPPHAGQFQRWLADRFHGEMTYLARNAGQRVAPESVLADARSIIVVGMNYYPGTSRHVARYAAGTRDYHELMGERLAELAELVDGIWYVDTGPVLERDLAQRAGIGFIGKHTNLISRQLGNWILLGAVLTTLERPADEPEREYCGTCRRCIDACPTRAIVAPYRLDARLCISYLTIELKGTIPVELRPLIGDHLFGCDDCLEVCPWNRFAKLSPVREFRQRELPALTEMLSWDERQFRAFFRGTPIFRVKRRGFLRNICVVLGNTGDASTLPALERALDDVEPLVREHAAWAIERIRQRSG